MSETRKLIQARRDLLKPSQVRLHHIPDWFRRALLRAYGCPWRDTSGHAVLFHHVGKVLHLDHYGSVAWHDGSRAFVSEPYGVTPAMVARAAEIAERIGCELHIDANSWWYPGSTIRLAFAQREGENAA